MKRARDLIALALDVPLPQAIALYEQVSAHVGVVKVGLSLFVEHGPAAVRPFVDRGAAVFLDLKLHDIPNTVKLAAQKAATLNVRYLTVHASGGVAMLAAAIEGAAEGAASAGTIAPAILAVTVLTSMSGETLTSLGVHGSVEDHVSRLAARAREAGVGGVVCSAREASAMRARLGATAVVCTPGVRPAGVRANDQARVETPTTAVKNGANLLVVGRPIYEAPSPREAAAAIEAEVQAALA